MTFYNKTRYVFFHLKNTAQKRTLKVFIFLCLLHNFTVHSQSNLTKDSITLNKGKIENLLQLDQSNSNDLFKENQTHRERALLFDAIAKNIQSADLILKTGIDYKGFTSELDYVIKLKKTAIDGIIKNKNDFQTLRNITVTSVRLK